MNQPEQVFTPVNPETDPRYNREPGVIIVPGSNFANEMMRFQQFPSEYGGSPGNPYVYRPFPKDVYIAVEHLGKPMCMAAPPDPNEYDNPEKFRQAEEAKRRFDQKCVRTVNNEQELQKAYEGGYRQDPPAAVEYALSKQRSKSEEAAHRNYLDRGMSDLAKREAKKADEAADGVHLPEIVEQPKKRRGRPPKVKPA